MKPSFLHGLLACALGCGAVLARPVPALTFALPVAHEITTASDGEGDPADASSRPTLIRTAIDTTWIADWDFDGPLGSCTSTGWQVRDEYILNDGSNYWTTTNTHDGQGGINLNASVLAKHDPCWVYPDGYGNNWDYAIVCNYQGAGATLSFDYLLDTEVGYDFLTVEADSACASTARSSFSGYPPSPPSEFRTRLFLSSGTVTNGHVGSLALPSFGGGTNCVYIRFASDGGDSPEDGGVPSAFGAGLVVDNIAVTGALAYTESFEGALNPNVTRVNSAVAAPFNTWAHLYRHASDSDKCTENTTCAWLFGDPRYLCGGSEFLPPCVRPWIDNSIESPWVTLPAGPGTTLLSFRDFLGPAFALGCTFASWSVRFKTALPGPGAAQSPGVLGCVTPWVHHGYTSSSSVGWVTRFGDLTPYIPANAREVQVRYRLQDKRLITGDPATCNATSYPYVDRFRIGRAVPLGPLFSEGVDSRSQAQDAFATVRNSIAPGEHFSPSGDPFGTCAFSQGADLGVATHSPNLVTGDSVHVQVIDARGAGGITSVAWYGAIVSGPHAGKAPPPWSVGANGSFGIAADSCRSGTGAAIAGNFFVDLDDEYFRGGDTLVYFWAATDAGGAFASDPEGLASAPASVAAAEIATNGLFEVSFLPSITWSASYLSRIAADAHGKLDPTPQELAQSSQSRCLLYVQLVNARRRSGEVNKTSFMHTLNLLGYTYDVYDVQGYGNTNNQIAGRATVSQATGYKAVVQDNGRGTALPNLPDGVNLDSEKVSQAQWYRDWLASPSLVATPHLLWLMSENLVNEKKSNPLIATDMGVTLISNDQGLNANPNVQGQTSIACAGGGSVDFAADRFALNGGCPTIRNYDALGASGTAVITHKYKSLNFVGPGAVVMNTNAAQHWTTAMSAFAWFDIRTPFAFPGQSTPPSTPTPETVLASKILGCIVTPDCHPGEPRLTGVDPLGVPRITALHQNVPNPFNPVTSISFALAQKGQVEIQIFDVSGHVVRTLVNGMRPAGRAAVLWNGLDDSGRRVASGVYLYRLTTGDMTATRRLVILK